MRIFYSFHRFKINILTVALLHLLFIFPAAAQSDGLGIAIKGIFPQSGFKEAVKTGFGISFIGEGRLSGNIALTADASWNRVESTKIAPVNEEISLGQIDFSSLQFGIRYYLRGPLFLGVEGGYFYGGKIQNEWGVLPGIGVKMRNVEIAASYKFLNNIQFIGIRVGLYLLNF